MFLKSARWITDKYILVMLGVFPLYCGIGGHAYTHITDAKYMFFLIATCVWLAASVLLALIAALRRERFCVRVRAAHLAMALFLLIGAVSAMFSEYGDTVLKGAERYDGYLTTVLYAAIFFGVSLLAAPKRRYAWALGISVTVCCVIAILQLGGLDPFHMYPQGLNYYDKYEALSAPFLGTIGNAGLLAAYLCLAAPLLTVFAVLSEKKEDTVLLLPGALALGVLALCDVDAGIIALAGCLLVTVPVVIRDRRAGRIAAGVSGGICLAGLGTLFFWPGQSGLFYELSQVLHGNLSDEFGSHRGQIWKACWRLFLEKPLLGGGPGTAGKRIDVRWQRYIEALGKDRISVVGNTHNVFLGYLVNIGIFGALSYLAAAGCTVISWIRRREESALLAALGSGFVCFMIQDFFGLGLCLTEPLLFVAWGLLESLPEAEREKMALEKNGDSEYPEGDPETDA